MHRKMVCTIFIIIFTLLACDLIQDNTECDPVLCDMYCTNGFTTDENGCEICECNEISKDYCDSDEDCACGVDIDTGNCAIGHFNYINTAIICPDFCAGIHGGFIISFLDNRCIQEWADQWQYKLTTTDN